VLALYRKKRYTVFMDGIGAYKKMTGVTPAKAEADVEGGGKQPDFSAENDWLSKLARFDEPGAGKGEEGGKAAKLPAANEASSTDKRAQAFVKIPEKPKKHDRLARFLALVGEDEAEKMLKELKGPEVVILRKEVEALRKIEPEAGRRFGMTSEEARSIYEEFRQVLSAKAESPKPLSFMEEFQAEQVALLLHKETTQTCAVVLARLTPKLAAGTLSYIEKERKEDIVFRIARLGPVAPEVVMTIAASLRERARELGPQSVGAPIDGIAALAEILKNADVSFGDKIISSLADQDPLLGRTLKERLYTLDDVCRAEDKPIALKLEHMSEQEIALLLRGRPESFKEKILANVSAGRRALIRDENVLMGAVLKSDAELALKDFLQWFRDKRDKGELLFVDEEVLV
jgi:flagellar motor switch protein FliG